ncbi:MAG: DUF481 domain-containing protein [Gemmatimonadaceae bacterium]
MPRVMLAVIVTTIPMLAHAQDIGRNVEVEVSASLLFGNTRQALATTRAAFERIDSSYAFISDARFNYGEATTPEGIDYVSKRSWLGSTNLDFRPFADVSPFLLGTIESSLERRIDLRYSAGAGSKFNLVRSERTNTDLSLALLAERSILPDSALGTVTRTLARWSARFRAEHELADRIAFTSETFYRPEVASFGDFTFSTSNSLGYQLTEQINIRVSFVDNYDSEARSRGARTNNDGEIVFGVLTTL